MCGLYDGNGETVNKSILSASCSNALSNCSSVTCILDYVVGAFKDRIFKFCPNEMNLLVTQIGWSSYAYGLEYFSPDDKLNCVAYCVP